MMKKDQVLSLDKTTKMIFKHTDIDLQMKVYICMQLLPLNLLQATSPQCSLDAAIKDQE